MNFVKLPFLLKLKIESASCKIYLRMTVNIFYFLTLQIYLYYCISDIYNYGIIIVLNY